MSGFRLAACGCCNTCGIDSTGSLGEFCCSGCDGFSPSTIVVSFNIPSVTWYQLCDNEPILYATIPAHETTTTMVKQFTSSPCGYQAGSAQLTFSPPNFYTYDCYGVEDVLWKGNVDGGAVFNMRITASQDDGYASDIDTPCESLDYCSGVVIQYQHRYYNSALNKYIPQLFNFSWNNGEITNCTYEVPFYSNYVSDTPTQKTNNFISCTIGAYEYCGGATEYSKDATGWSSSNIIWDCASGFRTCNIPNAQIISIT